MNTLKLLLIKLLLKQEEETMAMVYVSLICKGKKTYKQVPAPLKEQVKQILIDIDCEDLVIED